MPEVKSYRRAASVARWEDIWWAVDRMDKTHAPYASAQRILEVFDDVPELWEPGRGEELMTLLNQWDRHPGRRWDFNDEVRAHLRSLQETDVPPVD